MKAYKGFNKDMTCRDFPYREGGEYETDKAKLCDALQKAAESAAEIMERVRYKDGLAFNTANYIAGIAKDALAAPSRNCDVDPLTKRGAK